MRVSNEELTLETSSLPAWTRLHLSPCPHLSASGLPTAEAAGSLGLIHCRWPEALGRGTVWWRVCDCLAQLRAHGGQMAGQGSAKWWEPLGLCRQRNPCLQDPCLGWVLWLMDAWARNQPVCQWLFCIRISQQATSKLGVSLTERNSPFGAVVNISE